MNVNLVKRLALLFLIALTALPSHGRFISEDKWEGQQDVAPSLHKYLYTYQNPTVYVDPDGNAPVLAEMTNGLMSQVDYINNRATAYRKQGGLSGHFTATMMNVGAGVHAILGGAVGLVNTVADVSISGSASRLEGYGVEFNEYGVVADSRAHLSDVGTSLKSTGNTLASFHDRNVRSELGRGLVETGVGVINGDADALNRFATTSATFGAGGAFSKLNPTRLFKSRQSNSSLVTENPSGIVPRIHSNGQANSAQYANLKGYYANQDSGYVSPNTYRDSNGRLRADNGHQQATGSFVYDGGSKSRQTNGTHGNTAGNQPAILYERYDKDDNFLKHGVTQDLNTRYTKKELNDGFLLRTQEGSRKEVLKAERELVETNPGPLNKEPWAGKRRDKDDDK
ncbi:MAG: hypothetical protein JKX81_19785 [Arenicella sp.]|nr:hypothetical protein [Arenicella sp.]